MEHFVNCSKCGEQHYSGTIVTENIEEDIYGRDVITYTCPVTDKLTKSLVLITNFSLENLEFWKD